MRETRKDETNTKCDCRFRDHQVCDKCQYPAPLASPRARETPTLDALTELSERFRKLGENAVCCEILAYRNELAALSPSPLGERETAVSEAVEIVDAYRKGLDLGDLGEYSQVDNAVALLADYARGANNALAAPTPSREAGQ